MPTVRLALALLTLLGGRTILRAQPEEGPKADDIPLVGRPSDLPFSEASGWFEVSVSAQPTTLEAETPLTFTVSVHAIRETHRPPQRIDLRQLPAFAEQFYIEEPSSEEPARPDERTWQIVYRLKPRRTDVREIPSLPFVYFNPYLLTANKGFQVIYTDAIALHVLPHETVQVPVQAPENAFTLATGPGVLELQTAWTPPGIVTSIALLLTPPLVCAVWYICWLRMYPDAARQARQRRSRAARQALSMLHAAQRLNAEECANRAAAIVANYLQQRLDLTVAEPTPREVAILFGQRACSPALTEQAVRFFKACDSARFLPASGSERCNLPDSAIQLILAVEAETGGREPGTRSRERFPALCFLFVPLFVSSSPLQVHSPALSDAELLEHAEGEFQEGVRLRQAADQARPHFRSAADCFEELRRRGVDNALLYRNLGNAYLLADDLPHAILAYRRGLRLAPNDFLLRQSLAEARERVVYPPSGGLGRPPSDARPPWLAYPRAEWLVIATATAYVLAWVCLTRWRMVRRGRLLAAGLITLLLTVLLSAWLMVRIREEQEQNAHPLVVIARDGVLLRRGNGTAFPTRYNMPLPRGVEARRLFERSGWVQMELSGGEVGWLPREAVLVDTP
ncbi:MAG: tetratricopeptide repeat protein [Terriglobales bacterium]